ncbi:hypothetical protein [Erythrobacter aureus]|uniref:Uncharacterized protein n=1 Tax=Erythrobacter aureus TaxID=2182384 RepID=A0A345YCI2_9SPHN|nr:hypothetical protein [Erythrobacter aureus]AXK41634.1 hypothetical protein DVR09_04180 [Erythrobacter aureus]
MMRKLGISMAITALVGLAACEQAEQDADPNTAETEIAEAEIEQVTGSEAPLAERKISFCDGEGNRYASEEEAQAAGLEPAEYGATYCPEYLEPTMHPSWDKDGDGLNDCEKDGICDDSVDYTQPGPDA